MGDMTQARLAYDKAINLQGIAASKWLKLKRQNLGAEVKADVSAEEVSAADASIAGSKTASVN